MKTETANIKSKALFSNDRTHRLLLRKEWDKTKKTAMIIMINPNTADTLNMDLTTMLVINNLNELGFGCVNIANLYSKIMPKLSLRFNSDEDLLHEENDTVIQQYAQMSDAVIIAWGTAGNTSQRVRNRKDELLEVLEPYANKLYQIGEKGYHPLTPAIRTNWELEPYNLEVDENVEDNESE
ncbi:MAG: DUF1643 domain-containing protein [Oscillospiraceae bacterium]|nr:DUF1643 domain-containing protein [Oscillospiraceae bacterium]